MGVSDGRLRHATAGLAWKLVCCVELQEMVSWRHRGNLSILAKPHPARALRYAGGFSASSAGAQAFGDMWSPGRHRQHWTWRTRAAVKAQCPEPSWFS